MSDYPPGSVDELVPWLRNFDAITHAHRGRFGLDEGTLSRIRVSLALIEDAEDRLGRAQSDAEEATSTVAQTRLHLEEAERRHAEARRALNEATAAEQQAFSEAVSQLRPIVHRLRDREDSSRSRERLSHRSSPTLLNADVPAPSVSGRPSSPERGQAPSAVPVLSAPGDLVVVAMDGRVNLLTWTPPRGEADDASNLLGVECLIEASVGKLYRGSPIVPEPGAYRQIAALTGQTSYRHTVERVPAGVQVRYRARARRGDLLSAYGCEVFVTCK